MSRALHTYLASIDWTEGQAAPVVGLDLFFIGNEEEESIAPNQWGDGRPSIATMYETFKKIAARPEVSDVFVGLHPDWNDPVFADCVPPAETVFIVTSANQADVTRWVSGLHADGAGEGWPYGRPCNAPELASGHHLYWISWD
jgi:hypothetical protein